MSNEITHPSANKIGVTLNTQEITGSLCRTLAADPLIGTTVILFPAELEESSNKMDIRIYAGNLNKATTQEELTALFTQAGTVNSVDLVMDKATGLSKGFAFISMPDQAEADKAISMFNAYSLADCALKVNIAKPRVEHA